MISYENELTIYNKFNSNIAAVPVMPEMAWSNYHDDSETRFYVSGTFRCSATTYNTNIPADGSGVFAQTVMCVKVTPPIGDLPKMKSI